jgi:hypothetical protein
MTSPTVAVLFARSDSTYKALPGCDVYDAERDARTWQGGAPIVAHPPCRSWGGLRHRAKPREDERDLALFAVDMVREWGGVLEHPARSTLWLYRCMPAPGVRDWWGGWTLPIVQSWWGHRAEKATWLYIVGCAPLDVPTMPLNLGRAPRVVSQRTGKRKGMPGWRPGMRTAEREATPPALAEWLCQLARRCR